MVQTNHRWRSSSSSRLTSSSGGGFSCGTNQACHDLQGCRPAHIPPCRRNDDIVADLGFQSWVCAEVMLKALGSAMQDFSIRDHLAPFSRPRSLEHPSQGFHMSDKQTSKALSSLSIRSRLFCACAAQSHPVLGKTEGLAYCTPRQGAAYGLPAIHQG